MRINQREYNQLLKIDPPSWFSDIDSQLGKQEETSHNSENKGHVDATQHLNRLNTEQL